ncbi:DUF3243 domain-containing protein [Marinococcus halotolerans]|uniref:DUF3243 domain-containing protein n=1 Tax=Marinococcus halotolerans TaxID=301092 RepID=UPI0003B3DF69|nr:DUF3243 domain-containing protein [Marinococcus halotolerans]
MTEPKKDAEQHADSLSNEEKQDILNSFQRFQDYLKNKIHKGEKVGLDEEQLAKGAERVADYLNKHQEPENPEEKLLQEMWDVADKDEQRHLARILVRLAKEEGND